MEENKYYTPKLEEFHVGFEYEFNHPDFDENWIKYHTPQFNHELEDFCLSKTWRESFRVKYLDREDIESLGWVKRDEPYAPSSTYLPKTSILESYYKNKTELYIAKHSDFYPPKHLMIYQLSALRGYGDEEYRSVFKGIVKNKSELKKLMEMLQINS